MPKRVMAMREFAKTALYRKAAGLGDDGITMEECDKRVSEIIQVFA